MFTINNSKETAATFSKIPERDFFYSKDGDLYLKMYGGQPYYNAINLSFSEDEAIEWSDYWETFDEEDVVFPAIVNIEARMV